jgi:23S rRNA G2445 N2-methylase RlmL
MAEFTKLRDERDKRGKAAKAANERKVTQGEMCKYITNYADAEARWVKYAETNERGCGIPIQIVSQMKQMLSGTEQTKQRVCNAPQAVGPSLSDALGVTRPVLDNAKAGSGSTLDTLTGPAIR